MLKGTNQQALYSVIISIILLVSFGSYDHPITLFLKYRLKLFTTLSVRDQVSHSYKKKIVVFYIYYLCF